MPPKSDGLPANGPQDAQAGARGELRARQEQAQAWPHTSPQGIANGFRSPGQCLQAPGQGRPPTLPWWSRTGKAIPGGGLARVRELRMGPAIAGKLKDG